MRGVFTNLVRARTTKKSWKLKLCPALKCSELGAKNLLIKNTELTEFDILSFTIWLNSLVPTNDLIIDSYREPER